MRRKRLVVIPIIAVAMFVVFGLLKTPSFEKSIQPVALPAEESAGGEFVFSSIPVENEPSKVSTLASEACPQPSTDLKEYGAEREAHIREAATELSKSRDAEGLLAAALLSQLDSLDRPLKLLEEALTIDPDHPLVVWNYLQFCRDRKGANCDLAGVEENAVRVDGSNGAVWMEIAMLRLDEGDQIAAAEAVRRAIVAPRFDGYFIDQVTLIERALSTHGDSSYRDRIIAGMGFGAAMVRSYYGISKYCQEIEASDAAWIELCDQLGAQMLAEGTNLLDQSLGTSLRKIAARQSGNDEQYAKALAREAEFKRPYLSFTASRDAHVLLENDEAALRRYIENFSIYGEGVALTRLRAEAERLKNSPDYDQCNFVSRGLLPD